jgi:hypothetical protein
MVIGMEGLTGDPRCVRLPGMLALPFVGAGSDDAIGHGLEPTRDAR